MNRNLLKILASKYIFSQHQYLKTLPRNIEIKPAVDFDTNQLGNFKRHEGINHCNTIEIPLHLESLINHVLSDYPSTKLFQDASNLATILSERRLPIEKGEIRDIRNEIIENLDNKDLTNDDIENTVKIKLDSKINQWQPIDYNQRNAILYLKARFVPEYAVVFQVLNEIKRKDADFKPFHLFDFGSGLGSVMWAANKIWSSVIEENFNCDFSIHMNTLSELLTKNGSLGNQATIKNIVFKRNIPKASHADYELVTSAFSLLELPNRIQRFETIENLFGKVKKNGYLVLIETGNRHGFKLISEAREFIINEIISKQPENDAWSLFAPCPHQLECQLLNENFKCKFKTSYWPAKFSNDKNKNNNSRTFPYSYLIFKHASNLPVSSKWPRLIIRDPKKSKKTFDSWTCNNDGKIDHMISSKLRNKVHYNLLKYSRLGDNLPIEYSSQKNNDRENILE